MFKRIIMIALGLVCAGNSWAENQFASNLKETKQAKSQLSIGAIVLATEENTPAYFTIESYYKPPQNKIDTKNQPSLKEGALITSNNESIVVTKTY